MVARLEVLDQRAALQGKPGFSSSGCDPKGRCGNGLEKIYPTCAVRYGHMRYVGEFKYAPGMLFGCGGRVVLQTGRGIELGEQISLTCTGCDKSVSRKQMLDYVKRSGSEFMQLRSGKILRVATDQDKIEQDHLDQDARHKLTWARDLAREMKLQMKFVACEHLLGGERIIYHFMSEGRVDFRDLVKQLAREYHTRIEMHQVGARDEARLVADYEICGRECCCKNFLKKLRQVNMKMAKLQKATLDPSKVSGRCGRLRCCLRYEHEGYEEMNKNLPKVGNRIRTADGVGTIMNRQILTQLLSVQFDGKQERQVIAVEDILERNLPKEPIPEPERNARDADSRESRGDRETSQSRQRRGRRRPEPPAKEGATGDAAQPAPSNGEGRPVDQETGSGEEGSTSQAKPKPSNAEEDRQYPRSRRRRRSGRRGRGRRKGADGPRGSSADGDTGDKGGGGGDESS